MHYYVLFDNHTQGIELYNAAKSAGIKAQISPTPRELSVCCGISLLVREQDVESIKALAAEQNLGYIRIEGLDNDFDNKRHRYG